MVTPVLEPQSPHLRRDSVRAVSPVDHPVLGHRAPPMLDIGGTCSTLGSISDCESADRLAPGTVCVPWLLFDESHRTVLWLIKNNNTVRKRTLGLLIGMTMGQLDDYAFLVARLSRRYDPPEREEAHRAELRARTRGRNESADEFAEKS